MTVHVTDPAATRGEGERVERRPRLDGVGMGSVRMPLAMPLSLTRLPRALTIAAAAVLVLGTLLLAGIPLSSLTPLLAVGGCLGMHLLMGHGGGHGHHGHGGQLGKDR